MAASGLDEFTQLNSSICHWTVFAASTHVNALQHQEDLLVLYTKHISFSPRSFLSSERSSKSSLISCILDFTSSSEINALGLQEEK
ncbi:hypothetical protein Pint_04846 [Pistacia integerrima]|uniref:Uncharacterized protein n=1 Tax=Pistacia integerrima TaxID=434235 RepID=A0ACC0Z3T1_9ROSI|nr:hypothetical protein Pint_04846 [Pistacia integerrima]